MKNGWQTKRLGEIAAVGAGNSAPQDERLFKNGSIPFFRTADAGRIRFGEIDEAADHLNKAGASGLRRFPKGTILFPKSGASTFLNHRVMLGTEGCVSSHLATIVADEKQVREKFLLYFLSTIAAQDLVQDHAYPSLNLPTIAGIQVHLPALPEQERIVCILDTAFDAIVTVKAHTERNIQNARSLIEGHLQMVFNQRGEDWKEKPLGTLVSFRNGINYTKGSRGERVKIVGVKDFQKNYWVPSENLDTVTIDGTLPETDVLKPGDILVVRSNGNPELVGRSILAGNVSEKISHSGFTIRIRLSSAEVLPPYLCHFMKCASSRKLLIDGGTGMSIKSLNQQTLSNLRIRFPSPPKQKELVSTLESVSEDTQRLESNYQKKLAALDALKKSLLHQAFSGAL